MNRSEWIDSCTWRDPDCIECGGEGAPCCEPPDHPPVDVPDCPPCLHEEKVIDMGAWSLPPGPWNVGEEA